MQKSFQYAKLLERSGFTQPQVEAQISILTSITENDMATKADIQTLRQDTQTLRLEMKSDMSALRSEFEVFKSEMRSEFEAFKSEMRSEFRAFKTEMTTEFDVLRNEMLYMEQRLEARIFKKMMVGMTGLLALFQLSSWYLFK